MDKIINELDRDKGYPLGKHKIHAICYAEEVGLVSGCDIYFQRLLYTNSIETGGI